MEYFILKLEHDNGSTFLKTCSSTPEKAIENTMDIELCPRSAITEIYQFDRMFFGYNSKYLIKKGLAKKLNLNGN